MANRSGTRSPDLLGGVFCEVCDLAVAGPGRSGDRYMALNAGVCCLLMSAKSLLVCLMSVAMSLESAIWSAMYLRESLLVGLLESFLSTSVSVALEKWPFPMDFDP